MEALPRQASVADALYLDRFVRAVNRWGIAGAVACDVAAKGALYGTRSIADVHPLRRPHVWAAHLGIWAELNALRQVDRLRLWITAVDKSTATPYTSSRIDSDETKGGHL